MALCSWAGHFQSNWEAFQKSMETPSWSRSRGLQRFPKKFSVSNFSDFRKPARQLFGKIKVDDQGSQNARRGLKDQVSRHGQIPNIQPVETRLREVTQSKEPDFGALVLDYLC